MLDFSKVQVDSSESFRSVKKSYRVKDRVKDHDLVG